VQADFFTTFLPKIQLLRILMVILITLFQLIITSLRIILWEHHFRPL